MKKLLLLLIPLLFISCDNLATDTQKEIEQLKEEIASLKTELEKQDEPAEEKPIKITDIENLENKLKEIDDLKQLIEGIQTKDSDEELESLKAEIESIKTEIETLEAELLALKEKLNTAEEGKEEPSEPTNTEEPAEPNEPINIEEPQEPTEPQEPVIIEEPTEPIEPIEPLPPYHYSFDLDWYDIFGETPFMDKYIYFPEPGVSTDPMLVLNYFLFYHRGSFVQATSKKGGLVLTPLHSQETENSNLFSIRMLPKTPYPRRISVWFRNTSVYEGRKIQIKCYCYKTDLLEDITAENRIYCRTLEFDYSKELQVLEYEFPSDTTCYEFVPLVPGTDGNVRFIIESISINDIVD
jgi:archaellum component FlaC